MASSREIYIREVARVVGTDDTFIIEVIEHGLLPQSEEEEDFLEHRDLELLRRMARLHHDLGVNVAGLEVILEMRERLIQLQRELNRLRQREMMRGDEDVWDV